MNRIDDEIRKASKSGKSRIDATELMVKIGSMNALTYSLGLVETHANLLQILMLIENMLMKMRVIDGESRLVNDQYIGHFAETLAEIAYLIRVELELDLSNYK